MITIKKTYLKFLGLVFLSAMLMTSCEREVSEDAVPATFPTTAEVYTDNPVGLTDEFFLSFDPAFGANTEAFGTDDNEAYLGSSSIRLDIPAPNDPDGGFIGGIFKDRGEGRNLTGYDALTFWIKASRTATFDEIGFGTDFEDGKFPVSRANIPLSTDWKKITIPIPDPSKLTQEKGLFFFSTGTQSTDGVGFTVWIDEIKFEDTGTIGQSRPQIFGGQEQNSQANVGTVVPVIGLTNIFNLGSGRDVTVNAASAYYDFRSSNPDVAEVNEQGEVTIVGLGDFNEETGEYENNTSVITASIAGTQAQGSLTIEAADIDVLSIFSDVFANVPVDNYNGFYTIDGQTTEGGAPPANEDGNNVIVYTELNFVAIEFYGRGGSDVQPKDLTDFEFMHIDIRVDQELTGGETLTIELFNNFASTGQTSSAITLSASDLQTGAFVPFDIPLDDFPGFTPRDAVGAIIFSSGGISNVSLDNIYFYTEN